MIDVSPCLTGTDRHGVAHPISIHPHCIGRKPTSGPQGKEYLTDGTAYCMDSRGQPQAIAFAQNSRNELRLEGGDGSRTGALTSGGGKPGQGVPMIVQPIAFHPTQDPISSEDGTTHAMGTGSLQGSATVAIAFSCKDHGNDAQNDIAPTMRAMNHSNSHANDGGQLAVAIALRGREGGATAEMGDEVGNALRASSGGGDKSHVLTAMQVRRLTPAECARHQGFPDNWTQIPWRGKPASECPDGPQYKAYGNSWAVPVARWVGKRIDDAVRSAM